MKNGHQVIRNVQQAGYRFIDFVNDVYGLATIWSQTKSSSDKLEGKRPFRSNYHFQDFQHIKILIHYGFKFKFETLKICSVKRI